MNYDDRGLDTFGKSVADYMGADGERVLIRNNPGVPLRKEINTVGIFSNKNLKTNAEKRLKFDLGVIWSLALIVLRDELNLDIQQHLYSFLNQALKRTPKFGFEENSSIIYGLIEKADYESRDQGDDQPFNQGVMFAEVFLKEFYGTNLIHLPNLKNNLV